MRPATDNELIAVWHSGHTHLLSFMTKQDMEDRITFIPANKPAHQIATRLRLLKPVLGKLPDGLMEAMRVFWNPCYAEAMRIPNQATYVYNKAERVYGDEINTLHAIECPNCPWDGKTMFPEKSA